MAFLGLGSFGQGFVTGFASSVDKAVQKSVTRVRNRIDEVNDAKARRAEKAYEEHEEEINDVVKALKSAENSLGLSEDEAAVLLKDSGDLVTFKQRVNQFKTDIDQKGMSSDLSSFFDKDSKSVKAVMPSRKDFAKAFVGSPVKLQSILDTKPVVDAGLIGAIYGEEGVKRKTQKDFLGKVSAFTPSDITSDDTTVIPSFKFDNFAYKYASADGFTKLQLIQTELAKDPNITPEREKELKDKLVKQENHLLNSDTVNLQKKKAILLNKQGRLSQQIERLRNQPTSSELENVTNQYEKVLQEFDSVVLREKLNASNLIDSPIEKIEFKISLLKTTLLKNSKGDTGATFTTADQYGNKKILTTTAGMKQELMRLEDEKRNMKKEIGTYVTLPDRLTEIDQTIDRNAGLSSMDVEEYKKTTAGKKLMAEKLDIIKLIDDEKNLGWELKGVSLQEIGLANNRIKALTSNTLRNLEEGKYFNKYKLIIDEATGGYVFSYIGKPEEKEAALRALKKAEALTVQSIVSEEQDINNRRRIYKDVFAWARINGIKLDTETNSEVTGYTSDDVMYTIDEPIQPSAKKIEKNNLVTSNYQSLSNVTSNNITLTQGQLNVLENMEKYKAELPPDAKIKMIETAKQLLPLDEFSLEQNVFRLLNSKDYTNQNEAVKIYRNLHNLAENSEELKKLNDMMTNQNNIVSEIINNLEVEDKPEVKREKIFNILQNKNIDYTKGMTKTDKQGKGQTDLIQTSPLITTYLNIVNNRLKKQKIEQIKKTPPDLIKRKTTTGFTFERTNKPEFKEFLKANEITFNDAVDPSKQFNILNHLTAPEYKKALKLVQNEYDVSDSKAKNILNFIFNPSLTAITPEGKGKQKNKGGLMSKNV